MKVLCPKCGAECDLTHGYNNHMKFHPEEKGLIYGNILVDCDECYTTFVYRYSAYVEADQVQTMKEAFGL